ncbi:MAG: F-box protein [Holosporales bacterium]
MEEDNNAQGQHPAPAALQLTDLPDEILINIAQKVSLQDQQAMVCTNHFLHNLIPNFIQLPGYQLKLTHLPTEMIVAITELLPERDRNALMVSSKFSKRLVENYIEIPYYSRQVFQIFDVYQYRQFCKFLNKVKKYNIRAYFAIDEGSRKPVTPAEKTRLSRMRSELKHYEENEARFARDTLFKPSFILDEISYDGIFKTRAQELINSSQLFLDPLPQLILRPFAQLNDQLPAVELPELPAKIEAPLPKLELNLEAFIIPEVQEKPEGQ